RIQFAIPENIQVFPNPEHDPDTLFDQTISIQVGGIDIHAFHAKGETDDHLWVWVPSRKTVFTGDMVVSSFPNAGNPFKVQRFTLDWARGLEAIAGKEPEVLVPGHGSIVTGTENINELCLKTASALRYLHDEVVKRLNEGMWYEDIIHDVPIPDELTAPKFLVPQYGCPQFVVHAILREYTGWYDGNPSNLFPPKRVEISREIADLAGTEKIIERAKELQKAGREDMALQFVDIAMASNPDDEVMRGLHQLKGSLLKSIGEKEKSLISRNIYYNGYKSEMKLAGLEE
ncbi:MAG: MBL fold metallo-hydrolase, partial [Deltaproteobacteria bacterium]|nr:MBL fold metallo-hydrolase [Deltaproteobacteria bacterium]